MSAPRSFGVDVRVDGGSTRVTPFGELDIATAPQLADALAGVRADASVIVIDLAELGFVDSTGMRTLVVEHRLAQADGRQLVLLPGAPKVHRAFELTGLHEVLPFAGADGDADGWRGAALAKD